MFIRRITPWPIEPPLQVWRCPLGASFSPIEAPGPPERLFDAAFQATLPRQSFPEHAPVDEVQASDGADIDISGDAFDFVRSIRVFHIQYRQWECDSGDCNRIATTRLGSYGVQGNYRWTRSSTSQIPPASQLRIPDGCRSYFFRSVFVDGRDHEGNYDSDEVRY